MRNRCVALITRDALLYSELAAVLRERRIPTISLLPGQRIPDRVAVVLTSPAESPAISHDRVIAVPPDGDRTGLWAEVAGAMAPNEVTELVVGIDPGPRPGFAVLADDVPIADGILEDPEAAGRLGSHLRRRFPARAIRFRVGSGDRPSRDRILTALLEVHRPIELVDEQGTTPRGQRRPKDSAAARAIARTPGRLVHERPALSPRAGEIANLQRLSREGSGGRLTIPRHLAVRVLKGELTLSDAIADSEPPHRRASTHRSHVERAGAGERS